MGGWRVAALNECAGAMNMDTSVSKTILYVEDDLVALTAYRNRLLQEGFYVESAKDGLEAMKLLSLFVPDLVVLDLMLPKFNGVDVLKFIQSNPHLKTVPVIVLSTNSIIDAAQESMLERADKRLIKDLCTFPMMLQAIHEALAETSSVRRSFKRAEMKNVLHLQPVAA
jgi:CheY-like chemotaxis protein